MRTWLPVLSLLLGGCATTFDPLTVAEVEALAATQPEAEVVTAVQTSGTVYRLAPWQADKLQSEQLPVAVVAAMQQTYVDAVEASPELSEWNYYMPYRDGYWYGICPAANWGTLSLLCGQ